MTVISPNGVSTSSVVDSVANDADGAEQPRPVPVDDGVVVPGQPRRRGRARRRGDVAGEGPEGVAGFYLVALMSIAVSVDTSWRFFGQNLHITALWERIVMFAVVEVALIACGYGMRANVIRSGKPGAPRMLAWALCGMAAYMAWQLSGLAEGIARVALGPVLGLVMLHLALGIEVRARRASATTPWARIGRELRERTLSWFGLANEERDAVAFRRARAERRVARLSLATTPVLFRQARLARAVRTSNVAHDPDAKARMLADLAAVRHAHELKTLHQPSPWATRPASTATRTEAPRDTEQPPSTANQASRPHTATRSRSGARSGSRSGKQAQPRRRMLADYLTVARQHLDDRDPGASPEVTPAWVRQVIPDCPRTTSKTVADALNTERANTPTDRTEPPTEEVNQA